jgi:EAL domain-containing protein (putative c-di-GMP-specific phosphodiesterase class I)/CheY-like chemotaxis protein
MSALRLLILDDDLAIGQTIAMIANDIGVSTRFTSSHAEFFSIELEWQPTHIALDLVMPQMDGVQVLAQLAQRGSSAQVIITSGQGGRVLAAASRSASEHGLNIAGVLPKPFAAANLRSLLQSAIPDESTLYPTRRDADQFKVSIEEMQRALEQNELTVYYQPKVNCATLALTGFEALVRWNHPRHGIIGPDLFVPFAEQNGMIAHLTDQVMEMALSALKRWREIPPAANTAGAANAYRDITMSINLSATTLSDLQFVERMAALCVEKNIAPASIILEVTESGAMEHPTVSLDLLTRFRLAGFQVSIDDFGTGYSSMLQLVRLPFSEIKVEKSFVIAAPNSAEARSVIRCIVDTGP